MTQNITAALTPEQLAEIAAALATYRGLMADTTLDLPPSPVEPEPTLTDKIESFYALAIGGPVPAEVSDPEPSPVDTGERLTFRQVLLREVERFRGWDNATGDFLAEELAVLADRARFLSADSPAEYRDHLYIMENESEPQ